MFQKYCFKPGLLGTLVTAIGVGVFASLALWQLGRADERRELAALIQARMELPAFEYTGQSVNLGTMEYRRVQLKGRYEERGQILLDNTVMEGKPGYQVITPFRLESKGMVLVDRGWIPQGRTRSDIPDVAVPDQRLDIAGQIGLHRSKPVVGGDIPVLDDGVRWTYVNGELYRERFGYELPDFVIRLDADSPSGFEREAFAFEDKAGMHIGYAIQWAAFGVIALGTWVGLAFRRRETNQDSE